MTGAVAASSQFRTLIADWANTSGGSPQSNTDVTMMATCTLKVTWTGVLQAFVPIVNSISLGPLSGSGSEFSVTVGDAVHFTLTKVSGGSGTVTITNSTFGNEPVDTFTYDF